MLDRYFKDFFWSFILVALFASAYLVARTVNLYVGLSLAPQPDKLAMAAAKIVAPVTRTERIDLSQFLERNLFKAAREDLTPEPVEATPAEDSGVFDPDHCEPSSLGVKLLGTLAAKNPEQSIAWFVENGGTQKVFVNRIGDQLMEQAEIMQIDIRNVQVRRNGRCESFSLEEKPMTVATAAEPAPVEGPPADGNIGAGVKQLSGNNYEIPRSEIDNVLSNINAIATQARIVPSFQNGKANGFKLFAIRPNSLYSKIGIQNGDIIQRINGLELNSPDKALEIYSKLKDSQEITVDLVRRGKSESLSYNIR